MKKRSLRDQLYLYTSQEIPIKLLETLIELLTGFNSSYSDITGRVGVMGVTKDMAATFGFSHKDMMDEDKCVKAGTKCFTKILNVIRMAFPSASIADWYLLTISCYYTDFDKAKDILSQDGINGWNDYKTKRGYGSDFAERVWNHFKNIGGSVT